MKVSIIIPTNNVKKINKLINSYSTLLKFKKISELIVIGNGEVYEKDIKNKKEIKFIRFEEEFDIIPFVELRGVGIEQSIGENLLFLDDDHCFMKGSDSFLIDCVDFLDKHNECGVLELKKKNVAKKGFYIKRNAHIWTDRGLFMRNIFVKDEIKSFYKYVGACEDLIYSYEVLNNSYIPYEIHNSPISRKSEVSNRYKEFNHPSYSKELLNLNVIGFIKYKYNDKDWKFYGSLNSLEYPRHLKNLIKSRLSNLI